MYTGQHVSIEVCYRWILMFDYYFRNNHLQVTTSFPVFAGLEDVSLKHQFSSSDELLKYLWI
jgi:hypothetical protein